jgi:hypothetical protein
MDIRLDGRSAVITGGSKGLGLAMAQRFAASGADVAILTRAPETLVEAKQQIEAGARGKVAAVSADVSKAADIRRAYDQVMSELGKIDIHDRRRPDRRRQRRGNRCCRCRWTWCCSRRCSRRSSGCAGRPCHYAGATVPLPNPRLPDLRWRHLRPIDFNEHVG